MDPWSKLIRRAQAFRDALVQASTGAGKLTLKEGEKSRELFQGGLLRNLLTEEITHVADHRDCLEEYLEGGGRDGDEEDDGDDEDEFCNAINCRDLEQERPSDVAEEALLQELFFPSNKKIHLPSSHRQRKESLLDRSMVCLTVNVGKLLLCQGARNAPQEMVVAVGTDALLSSCLLTLTFPAITEEKVEVGCSSEQCISIRPIKGNGHEFVFDHHSQLFWKLPSNQDLSSVWNAQQMMKASIEVIVGGRKVFHGNAYIPLQNVVEQSPAPLQLYTVLVGCTASSQDISMLASSQANNMQEQKSAARRCQKNIIPTSLIQDDQKPLAMLEIGLKLVHDARDCGNASLSKNLALAIEGAWLYVYIHNGLSLMKCEPLQGRSKSVMFMIKAGNESVLRLFFRGSSTANTQKHVVRGDFVDALLMSLDRADRSTVFIEVWCNHGELFKGKRDGLENLIGLAKVPLSAVVDRHKSSGQSVLDGSFSLWHPQSNSEGQKLRITVYHGSKTEMLIVMQEIRSVVVIQRHCRWFLERLHKKKARQRLQGNRGIFSSQGEILRHVFEVTVQRAQHIPVEKLSNNGYGYNYRGVFIKYIFPGEDDPLFTHDVELQKTVVFGATAHHRITLAQDQTLVDYLENLDEDTNGLRFELWSDVWDNRKNSLCEAPCQGLTKSEENYKVLLNDDEMSYSGTEKCIGSATLPMQELIGLLERVYQDQLSLKIKRLFNLPIKFHKWVESEERTPNLTVHVAYDRVELTESHLLDGTIFYNYMSAPHLPLKSLLEVMVLDVKINQAKLPSSMPHINLTIIRFSLFPCNRELESKYPPIMTHFDEMDYQLKSTYNIMLDALTIKELWESYMTFEVWQQRPQKHESLFLPTSQVGIWIGAAIAPCVMLISQKQGVCGMIDLIGLNKQSIGSLHISVKFSEMQAAS